MRSRLIPTLLLISVLPLAGCDKKDAAADGDKKADKKDAKAKDGDKKAAKDGDKKEAPKEVVKAEPKIPPMEPMKIEAWGVELKVPAGSKMGELEDGEDIMADTLDIDMETGCGVEISFYRHKKSANGVEEMFKNATGPSGNKDDKYPIKEKTDDGYKVQHSWLIPLGDTMWKSEVGKVLGDHLYLCGAGDLMGVEKAQADCALAACETLALSGG